jgi:hypothetical protein
MKSPKVLSCQNCDAEMEVAGMQNRDQVVCRRCGRLFRLFFSEAEPAWVLQPPEPVENAEEERRQEEPFSVRGEVGRPRRVDRSEKQREQTGPGERRRQTAERNVRPANPPSGFHGLSGACRRSGAPRRCSSTAPTSLVIALTEFLSKKSSFRPAHFRHRCQ